MRSPRRLLVLLNVFVLWSAFQLYKYYKLPQNIVRRHSATSTATAGEAQSDIMASTLKFLTVAARAKHTATVIFVHGLGDSGHGWQPVASMLGSTPAFQHIKWVLPHAPEMPVTANGGLVMPSWFDIEDFGFEHDDEPGMLRTVRSLNQLITAEVDAGIPSERIVLGGFSQGAAMTLLTGLTSERKLGGLIIMSGWLPLGKKFKAMTNDHAKKIPIFWGHGQSDPLVRYQWAQRSKAFLENELGIGEAKGDSRVGLEFHGYPGLVHSAGDEELQDMQTWLGKVLPPIN
ncbi:Phospholipase/carboxylesterase [Irpex rosettiformis]|uniref:Phospholipase/carboxylesterase n=1 Tax=Irpex rosettiformis TaxID=378272 RepID=A0ACB8U4W3_9APHY|nr:Phospholipase/carboxylesterase [Irpex rosettiformis]